MFSTKESIKKQLLINEQNHSISVIPVSKWNHPLAAKIRNAEVIIHYSFSLTYHIQYNTYNWSLSSSLFFLMFIYFWERDRAWAGEGQREREREAQIVKQAPGSELSAQSLMWGSNPWTARSWPEPKLDHQLSHPGAPLFLLSHRISLSSTFIQLYW